MRMETKLKIGDLVRHKASGELGVIVEVSRGMWGDIRYTVSVTFGLMSKEYREVLELVEQATSLRGKFKIVDKD